ncbi:hypothetical protein QBC39DRAFT_103968 [Podospora conica]|nr:hypothetical protein QBC39DRAFT_103968 [Schizothecium conicum]
MFPMIYLPFYRARCRVCTQYGSEVMRFQARPSNTRTRLKTRRDESNKRCLALFHPHHRASLKTASCRSIQHCLETFDTTCTHHHHHHHHPSHSNKLRPLISPRLQPSRPLSRVCGYKRYSPSHVLDWSSGGWLEGGSTAARSSFRLRQLRRVDACCSHRLFFPGVSVSLFVPHASRHASSSSPCATGTQASGGPTRSRGTSLCHMAPPEALESLYCRHDTASKGAPNSLDKIRDEQRLVQNTWLLSSVLTPSTVQGGESGPGRPGSTEPDMQAVRVSLLSGIRPTALSDSPFPLPSSSSDNLPDAAGPHAGTPISIPFSPLLNSLQTRWTGRASAAVSHVESNGDRPSNIASRLSRTVPILPARQPPTVTFSGNPPSCWPPRWHTPLTRRRRVSVGYS